MGPESESNDPPPLPPTCQSITFDNLYPQNQIQTNNIIIGDRN